MPTNKNRRVNGFRSIVNGTKPIGPEPLERRVLLDALPAGPTSISTPTGTGWIENLSEGGYEISVVHVEGDYYDMGFQHGYLVGEWAEITMATAKAALLSSGEVTEQDLIDAANLMEPHIPEKYMEEMIGMIDGVAARTGHDPVDMTDMIIGQSYVDFAEYGCSQFAAFGSRTENGDMYYGRNADWGLDPEFVQNQAIILLGKPKDGYAFLFPTWAGFVGGMTGINEKGLATAQDNCSLAAQEGTGTPYGMMMRDALETCSNVDELVAVYQSTVRTMGFTTVIADGLAPFGEMDAGAVEATQLALASFGVDDPDEDHYWDPDGEQAHSTKDEPDWMTLSEGMSEAIVRTNHFIDWGPWDTDPGHLQELQIKEFLSPAPADEAEAMAQLEVEMGTPGFTVSRYLDIQDAIEAYAPGAIGADEAQAILDIEGVGGGSSIHACVFDATTLEVWIANAYTDGEDVVDANDAPYVYYNFGEALGPTLLGIVETSKGDVYVYDCDGITNGIPIDGDYENYDPDDDRNDLLIKAGSGGVTVEARKQVMAGGVKVDADFSGLGIAVDGYLKEFKDKRPGTGDVTVIASSDGVGKVGLNSELSGLGDEGLNLPGAAWSVPTYVSLYTHGGGIDNVNIGGTDGGGFSLMGWVVSAANINRIVTAGHMDAGLEALGYINQVSCGGDMYADFYANQYIDRIESDGSMFAFVDAGWYVDQISSEGPMNAFVFAQRDVDQINSGADAFVQLWAGWNANRIDAEGDLILLGTVERQVGRVSCGGDMWIWSLTAGWGIGRIESGGEMQIDTLYAGAGIDRIRSDVGVYGSGGGKGVPPPSGIIECGGSLGELRGDQYLRDLMVIAGRDAERIEAKNGDISRLEVIADRNIGRVRGGTGILDSVFYAMFNVERIQSGGDFEGEVLADRDVGRVESDGDFTGIIDAGRHVDRVSVEGDFWAELFAGGNLGRLDIGGFLGVFDSIIVEGEIDRIRVDAGMDTVIEATRLNRLEVRNGDLDGAIDVLNSIGRISVQNGDLNADIQVGYGGIDTISVDNGLFRGVIDTTGFIKKLDFMGTALGDGRATIIADMGIGKLNVDANMEDTDVGVGVRGVPSGVSVALESVRVGGAFHRSNILAGVWNEPTGASTANPFSDGGEDGTPANYASCLGTVRIEDVRIDGQIGDADGSVEWAIASKDLMDDFEPEFAGNTQQFRNVLVVKDV